MARFDSVDVSSASTGASAHSGIAFSNLDYTSMFGARSLACAPELLFCRATGEDGAPIIVPESAGRRGAFPELTHCEGHRQEWDCLVTRIRDEQANGRVLSDMAILYRSDSQALAAEYTLSKFFSLPKDRVVTLGIAYLSLLVAVMGSGSFTLESFFYFYGNFTNYISFSLIVLICFLSIVIILFVFASPTYLLLNCAWQSAPWTQCTDVTFYTFLRDCYRIASLQ